MQFSFWFLLQIENKKKCVLSNFNKYFKPSFKKSPEINVSNKWKNTCILQGPSNDSDIKNFDQNQDVITTGTITKLI